MKCLVTGAAGFIGSHLCERLICDGHQVVGVDAFVPYYPRPIKEANLRTARRDAAFTFHELDLRTQPLDDVLAGVDVVFHLAANAGLPRSWTQFDLYESCNVTATQRLLEAAVRVGVGRFVYASTSSVYGRFAAGDESLPTRPISPYGVTKLAAEQLCRAYAEEMGLPLVVLRYFSVYGPRQRPDMGYHRFINALVAGDPITVFGDGQQVRGNTYISDCIEATIRAAGATPGETYNVGGGETASVWDIIRKLERITQRRAITVQEPARAGDQRSTCADTTKLTRELDWRPRVGLDEGLALQVDWQVDPSLRRGGMKAVVTRSVTATLRRLRAAAPASARTEPAESRRGGRAARGRGR
jgi:nucleoside-diphosphate-sugar epimerase